MKKVLLAYCTTHGSTQETAERILKVLMQAGLKADLQEARSVRSLDGYDAVVLGFPLYMFKMHKDSRRFLSRFQKEFRNGLPLAVFAGGPIEPEKKDEQLKEAAEQVEKELGKFPELKPVSVLTIGGFFDPDSLKLPYSIIPAMKQFPAADLRDWDRITAWAEELPGLLK